MPSLPPPRLLLPVCLRHDLFSSPRRTFAFSAWRSLVTCESHAACVVVVMAVGASCARKHTLRNVWRAPLCPTFSLIFELFKF